MIRTGLVSVTFRALPAQEIVALVARAGLDGIEWGGDAHVPHGDLARARDVQRMTVDAGLHVLAYGSYFRCRPNEAFEPVLASAVELRAPLIRIWAGELSSDQADAAARETVAEQARRCVALAAPHGIDVAFEFHSNTLTDTVESAVALLDAAPGMRTLWQAPHNQDEAQRLAGLRTVLSQLANLHVFCWRMPGPERLPLHVAEMVWAKRLRVAAECKRDYAALLEFVRDDQPEQFIADAETLKRVVASANTTFADYLGK